MDYTLNYPAKNTAVINFTISKADFEKEMETAKQVNNTEDVNQLRQFVISNEAGKVLTDAVDSNNLKLATTPALVADDEENGNVSVTLTCELLPEVKLGQYTDLGVVLEESPVTEEEVNAELDRLISAQKLWEDVPANTAAKEGDQVIIDFVGEKDGVPFEGGSGENFPLVLGSHAFIPGFEEQLVGAVKGEKVKVDVTFPENYFEQSLAGQPVVFLVTVKEIQEEIKPELNDAFLEKMKLEGIHTVEELRNRMHEDLKNLKEQEASNKAMNEILTKIADGSEVEIPDSMVNTQIDQLIAEYENSLKQYGMTLDQYLQFTGQSLDTMKEQLGPQAILSIRQALVLEAIAAKEAITAEQKELDEEYALLSRMYNFPAEQLKLMIPEGAVATQIVQRKTMDFLKDRNLKK